MGATLGYSALAVDAVSNDDMGAAAWYVTAATVTGGSVIAGGAASEFVAPALLLGEATEVASHRYDPPILIFAPNNFGKISCKKK